MTKLEISLLGNFSISAPGGSGVDLQRKYKLVLAALALVGADGMSRERLIELLWPGQDEEKGRANLRQALTACRKYLGSYRACLESAGDTLTLDPDSTVVDTNEFIRLADAATADGYNSAIAIYRGSLLDGLPL